jgi:hypothetical protein
MHTHTLAHARTRARARARTRTRARTDTRNPLAEDDDTHAHAHTAPAACYDDSYDSYSRRLLLPARLLLLSGPVSARSRPGTACRLPPPAGPRCPGPPPRAPDADAGGARGSGQALVCGPGPGPGPTRHRAGLALSESLRSAGPARPGDRVRLARVPRRPYSSACSGGLCAGECIEYGFAVPAQPPTMPSPRVSSSTPRRDQ